MHTLRMGKKIIGILGGMGPDATAVFFSMLVKMDVAPTDQDHIHIIVDSNTSIPDRTANLVGTGPNPLPEMLISARRLVAAGAQIAGMPCMTAHAYLPEIRRHTTLQILSAFEETRAWLNALSLAPQKLGILGTIGTRRASLFENAFPDHEILWPEEKTQHANVMKAIYGTHGIKAGNFGKEPYELLMEASRSLIQEGAHAIVAGCTEVPLVLSQKDFDIPYINPMQCLAQALIATASSRKE